MSAANTSLRPCTLFTSCSVFLPMYSSCAANCSGAAAFALAMLHCAHAGKGMGSQGILENERGRERLLVCRVTCGAPQQGPTRWLRGSLAAASCSSADAAALAAVVAAPAAAAAVSRVPLRQRGEPGGGQPPRAAGAPPRARLAAAASHRHQAAACQHGHDAWGQHGPDAAQQAGRGEGVGPQDARESQVGFRAQPTPRHSRQRDCVRRDGRRPGWRGSQASPGGPGHGVERGMHATLHLDLQRLRGGP